MTDYKASNFFMVRMPLLPLQDYIDLMGMNEQVLLKE